MIVYHASTVVVEKPEILYSRNYLDFGKGFYVTVIREQAEQYALRFVRRFKEAYINEYELEDNLGLFNLKNFSQYDEEWLDYVSACRLGKNDKNYDMISGGIADDRVFNTVDLYFAGEINKEFALKRLVYTKPNHQICILNQNILDNHLKFIKATKLKD